MQNVRMSDVARVAGVSTMTVSRVLNENASVLEETRHRVFEAVEQLGYRRNELARSLRDRRSRQVGILLPNLCDPFFAMCAHAVNSVARKYGYSVSTAMTEQNPEIEYEEARRMLHRSVEGLLVIPADVSGTSRLLSPEFAQIPIVTMDRPANGAMRKLDTFGVQNKEGAMRGTEHLLALGHKRIVCFALTRRLYTIRMRINGYEAAMTAAGYKPVVREVPEDVEPTLVTVRELMNSKRPPTAVFCANNLVTKQVLHSLQSMQLYPPSPVALVGFDDFELADLMRPGITVVRQPVETMAREAAEAMFARLTLPSNGKHDVKKVVLPVELVVRGSCGSAER